MVEKILQETKTINNFNKWHIVTNGKIKPATKTNIYNNNNINNKTKLIQKDIKINKNAQKNTPKNPPKLAVNVKENKTVATHKKENSHQQQTQVTTKKLTAGNTTNKSIQLVQQQARRRRSNQQEIRQIKRAHRHLLTSGGYDKQQKQQQQQTNCQNNSCSPSSSSSSSSSSTSSTSSSALKKTHKKLKKLSSGKTNNNKNSTSLALNNNKNSKKLLKHSKITNKSLVEQQQQHHNKQKQNNKKNSNTSSALTSCANKQQQQQKKLTKGHQKKFNDQESIISSRWCSIEEQLDLLDKLLYYCDEDENAALKHWYDTVRNKELENSYTANYSEEEVDSLSDCDWSWSDIMSSSSTSATTAASSSAANEDAQSCISNASLTSSTSSCNSSLVPSSLKRRGHQHHPRFSGTRRPNVPPNVQEILAALYKNEETNQTSSTQNDNNSTNTNLDNNPDNLMDDSYTHYNDEPEDDPITAQRIKASLNLPLTESVTTSMGSNSPTPTDDSSMLDEGVVSAQTPTSQQQQQQPPKEKKSKTKRDKSDKSDDKSKDKKSKKSKKDKSKRSSACLESTETLNDAASAATDEGIAIDDDDVQSAEWAKLRCTSEAAEIVAEREARRNKNRCADYPGLAFGRSIFSSDTMMKFNIIRNELHNIMNTQLKRVNEIIS